MSNKMESFKAIVHGKVQGVFFRFFTQRKADELNLTGCIRNLPNETVEVLAKGESLNINKFKQWLWKGSPQSKVSHIIFFPKDIIGYHQFIIRY